MREPRDTLRVGLLAAMVSACAARRPPEPMQRDKATRPALSTAEALRTTLEPRRRAVVIGVADYLDPAFAPLKHAEADATAVGALLAADDAGGFDEVTVLTGADRQDITRALQTVRRDLRREDVLVVYFSGHGTADVSGRRYLLTADSRARDLPGTAIDLTDLQDYFSELAPARKALIVDACFSGDGKSTRPPDAPPVDPHDPLVSARASAMSPGESHLFATSPGRPAREDDQLGHAVYTWFLLDALSWSFAEADRDGDGVVTAYEAHDHARGRTMDRTGGVQVPEATFRVVGDGDLALVGRPSARTRRDRALVYLYPPTSHVLHGARIEVDGRDKGSLPGTLVVTPGMHHVRILGPSGELLAAGSAELRGGAVVPADALVRMVDGPAGSVGVTADVGFGQGLLDLTDTPALMGGTVRLERRDADGVRRGLLRTLSLHGAVGDGRSFVGLTGGLGVQHDWRRLRWETTLTAGGSHISPGSQPDALGWAYLHAGPQLGLGLVLTETVSVGVRGTTAVSWLDRDLDGAPEWVVLPRVGLGLEWSH